MLCPKKNYTREMLTKKIPALENFSPTLSPPPPSPLHKFSNGLSIG